MDENTKSFLGEDLYNQDNIRYEDIAPYLLVALHFLGGYAHGKDVVFRTIELMHLKDSVLQRSMKSDDRAAIEVRIRFCMSYLRMAGYIKSRNSVDERGYWRLSQQGRGWIDRLLLEHEKDGDVSSIIGELREKYSETFKTRTAEKRKLREQNEKAQEGVTSEDIQEEDREEDEIDKQRAEDLEKIRAMDPFAFERLCVQVLRKMGAEMNETKKSGDGGIDGFGSVAVGLVEFKTVMQAKRYQEDNLIQETQIRDFVGAINVQRADRGIFITTSSFAHKARELAREHTIVLIDGEDLIQKMWEYNIGYKKQLNLTEFET